MDSYCCTQTDKSPPQDRYRRLTCENVELRGFEPLTPSMRTQRTTGQTAKVTAFAQVSDLRAVTITAYDAA